MISDVNFADIHEEVEKLVSNFKDLIVLRDQLNKTVRLAKQMIINYDRNYKIYPVKQKKKLKIITTTMKIKKKKP